MLKPIKNTFLVVSTISFLCVMMFTMGILKVNSFYFLLLAFFCVSYVIFVILNFKITKDKSDFVFGLLYNFLYTMPSCLLYCVSLRKIQFTILVSFVVLSVIKKKVKNKKG